MNIEKYLTTEKILLVVNDITLKNYHYQTLKLWAYMNKYNYKENEFSLGKLCRRYSKYNDINRNQIKKMVKNIHLKELEINS